MAKDNGEKLAVKMAQRSAIVGLLVAVLFSGFGVAVDFYDEMDARDKAIQEMVGAARLPATSSVLLLDKNLANDVLNGLLNYEYVIEASLADDLGLVIGEVKENKPYSEQARFFTRLLMEETTEINHDLIQQDKLEMNPGVLKIVINNGLYLSNFYNRALLTFFGWLSGVLLIGLFLFYIFHDRLTRPLIELAKQMDSLDPTIPGESLITIPQKNTGDELGNVAKSANRLISSIRQLLLFQREANKKLAESHDELELRVVERTKELEHEISERKAAEDQLVKVNHLLEQRVEERTIELKKEIDQHKETEIQLSEMKEEADSANRAKTAFLANMSHELRTPLNAIIGFATIMDDELFGPLKVEKYKSYVQDIIQSGTHLTEILGNILDLAKIEVGEIKLEKSTLKLENLFDECKTMFAVMCETSKITLDHDLDESFPTFEGDHLRVKQVIINFVANSIKFTPAGGVITMKGNVDDDGDIIISVQDTGLGIPEDKLEHVLEPFAQVEAAFNIAHKGVGLGLSLCKTIVELHGGSLWIESVEGEGTTVFAKFPPVPHELSKVKSGAILDKTAHVLN